MKHPDLLDGLKHSDEDAFLLLTWILNALRLYTFRSRLQLPRRQNSIIGRAQQKILLAIKRDYTNIMNEQGFNDLIAFGREQSGVEFKGPGSRDDKAFLVKVIRATLGFANRRDGGRVVIGVAENDAGAPIPIGLSSEQLSTWTYDDVADSIDEYADPNVDFELETVIFENKKFVTIEVQEFNDIPVLCKRTYNDILRKGACYVRPRRKPETIEIPSQADMRDLLDLASEKRLRKFLQQGMNAGLVPASIPSTSDAELFSHQIKNFLG